MSNYNYNSLHIIRFIIQIDRLVRYATTSWRFAEDAFVRISSSTMFKPPVSDALLVTQHFFQTCSEWPQWRNQPGDVNRKNEPSLMRRALGVTCAPCLIPIVVNKISVEISGLHYRAVALCSVIYRQRELSTREAAFQWPPITNHLTDQNKIFYTFDASLSSFNVH